MRYHELARGSLSRKAHLRADGTDRCGDNAKARRPFFRSLYNATIAEAIFTVLDDDGGWLSAVKTLGAVFYPLLSCNILEKITPARDG